MADVPARAEPPAGIDPDKLLDGIIAAIGPEKGNDFWQWLTSKQPAREAEVTARLEAVHRECQKAP